MELFAVLLDAHSRSTEVCHQVVSGLTTYQLDWSPSEGANTISWLIWHLARQQDAQIAALAGTEQLWTVGGWARTFNLDLPDDAHGYGQTAEEASRVSGLDGTVLLGYLNAAAEATAGYLSSVTVESLDQIVDKNWDPPVTRGVRLVSIIDDAAQHAGQAAYVRGLQGV